MLKICKLYLIQNNTLEVKISHYYDTKMIDAPLQTCYYIKVVKTNVNFLVSEINFIKLMLRKCNFDY